MMKNILVPLGISSNSSNTLNYAIDLAKQFQSSIYVIDSHNYFGTVTMTNIKEVIEGRNFSEIKKLVVKAKKEKKFADVKLIEYEGDLLGGIENIDKKINIDLIVLGPKSNDIHEKIFLGQVSGRIVKKTNIPVLLVPIDASFEMPNNLLLAFKKGKINGDRALEPLKRIMDKFKAKLDVLLVKTPESKESDYNIDPEIEKISEGTTVTSMATVYQGVLKHFESKHPDILVVVARKRGFFAKLMEVDRVYKKDFYCSIPLLILKNR